jgi:hypothetical protein
MPHIVVHEGWVGNLDSAATIRARLPDAQDACETRPTWEAAPHLISSAGATDCLSAHQNDTIVDASRRDLPTIIDVPIG